MFYENELRFLADTFQKCLVRAEVILLSSLSVFDVIDADIAEILLRHREDGAFLEKLEERTLYRYTDELSRSFCFLKLPAQRDQVLLIGPYVSEPLSKKYVLELGERVGISPKNMKYFEEYFLAVPVIDEKNPLFIMLAAFCERIWQGPSFAFVDMNAEQRSPASPINDAMDAAGSLLRSLF